jgi:hypothetical protein
MGWPSIRALREIECGPEPSRTPKNGRKVQAEWIAVAEKLIRA